MIEPDDVVAAAERTAGHLRRTPVVTQSGAEAAADRGAGTGRTHLKLEMLQHTGSFKPRGAFNRVLSSAVPEVGLIAASGGNHGVAVAHVAEQLGLAAEIHVPAAAPATKLDRLRATTATLVTTGELYDDAQRACDERAAATGALVVHPYDQPEVVAGQATAAMEFEQQRPELDTVLVAVGGGGLIGGAAAWFTDRVRIVAVEPDTSCCLHAARVAGRPVEVSVSGVASDSLGARQLGQLAWALTDAYVDDAVLVADDDIRAAQRALWDEFRVVAEPGGAAAFAALRAGAYRPAPDEEVGVLVCGANTDPGSVVG